MQGSYAPATAEATTISSDGQQQHGASEGAQPVKVLANKPDWSLIHGTQVVERTDT